MIYGFSKQWYLKCYHVYEIENIKNAEISKVYVAILLKNNPVIISLLERIS